MDVRVKCDVPSQDQLLPYLKVRNPSTLYNGMRENFADVPPSATGTNSLRAAGCLLSQPPLLTERNLRCVDTRNRTCSWVSTPPTRTDSKACVEKLVPGSTKVKMRSEAAAAAEKKKALGPSTSSKLSSTN